MKAVAVLAVLIVAGLAGCVSKDDHDVAPEREAPPETAPAETDQGLPAAPLRLNVSATEHDWFIASLPSDPVGTVTGFRWDVPDGYVTTDDFWSYMRLEFAPLAANASLVEDWALYVFRDTEDGARLIGSVAAPSVTYRGMLAVLESETPQPPSDRPFSMSFYGEDLDQVEALFLVVAARSAEPSEFAIGIRHRGDEDNTFARNRTEFLEDRKGRPPLPLTRLGNASSFEIAYYSNTNALVAFGSESFTDHVIVDDRLPVDARPASTLRDVTLSVALDVPPGWTHSTGGYFATDAVAKWEADVKARDTAASGASLYARSQALLGTGNIAPFLLFGAGGWRVVGEGDGPDTARFDLQVASVNYVDSLRLLHQSLGAPLEDLIGSRAARESQVGTGLLGDVPPTLSMSEDGSVTRIEWPDGVTQLVLGA